MSKAARQRRFLRWKKYRRQCTELTGQRVPFTRGMTDAWMKAFYRVDGGKFWGVPSWHIYPGTPYGTWEQRSVG